MNQSLEKIKKTIYHNSMGYIISSYINAKKH